MVILGVKLTENKTVVIALTKLVGIGYTTAKKICMDLSIPLNCKVSNLSHQQQFLITNLIRTNFKIEENLHREVKRNIQQYINNGSTRGFRHRHGLPVRGQRTHTNGKTQKKRKFNF